MYNILSYDSIHSSKRLNNTQSAENYVRNTLAEVSVFTLPLSIENLGFNTCVDGLVAAVQQYWASETVNCFLEIGVVKYTPSHTAFF